MNQKHMQQYKGVPEPHCGANEAHLKRLKKFLFTKSKKRAKLSNTYLAI